MSHRVIKGLLWATICGAPAFAQGAKRPKGAKAKGLKYEAEIAKKLGCAVGSSWIAGQWFQFEDANGRGYCQVDFLNIRSDAVAVLEAKLSWCPEAHTQLEKLYRPVVEKAFGRPMIGLVITKRLTPECRGAIAQTLGSALEAAKSCRSVVLHWSTKAPLVPVTSPGRPTASPLSARALTL